MTQDAPSTDPNSVSVTPKACPGSGSPPVTTQSKWKELQTAVGPRIHTVGNGIETVGTHNPLHVACAIEKCDTNEAVQGNPEGCFGLIQDADIDYSRPRRECC